MDAPVTEPDDPLTSPARLAAVRASELLDGAPEEAFDRLTRLAAHAMDAPVSLVSVVAADRQVFKSQVGLSEPWASRRQTPLTLSLCQHVVRLGRPLVVASAPDHALARDSPAVEELGVIAYAGVPITDPSGHCLGSICAIDTRPRDWTAAEIALLEDIAALVDSELALRETLRRRDESVADLLGRVADEVRSPLLAVRATVRALLDTSTPDVARHLRRIEDATAEALERIDHGVQISRLAAAGGVPLEIRPVDAGRMLNLVAGMMRPLVTSDDFALAIDEPASPIPLLRTDPTKLSELLRALTAAALRRARYGVVRVDATLDGDGRHVLFRIREASREPLAGAPAVAHRLATLLGGSVHIEEHATTARLPLVLADA